MNMAERCSTLKAVVGKYLEECAAPLHIFITQVDPDAVGSALGLQMVLESLGAKSEIYFCGNIGHPQNRACFNRYGLEKHILPFSVLTEEEEKDFAVRRDVLVDSSSVNDGRLGHLKLKIHPVIVIDHHRNGDVKQNGDNFVWVEDMGAASTLVTELIGAMELNFGEQKHIATMLALGIYSDTKALVSAGERDRQAYAQLMKVISPMELYQFINYPLPASHYERLTLAYNNREVRGSRLVTHVGYIQSTDGDDLSTIADHLMRMDGISIVIVWGIIDDGKEEKVVRISARCDDVTTSLSKFLSDRFGPGSGSKLMPDGTSEGGAIILVSLGFWLDDTTKKQVLDLIKKKMSSLVFAG